MTRPADVAVAVAQLMIDLALVIHENDPYRERNLGAALEPMLVAQLVIASTGQGKSLKASEIAERLSMPRTNVVRHLKLLVTSGRVHRSRSRYVADLELLDNFVTLERFKRIREAVTETARAVSRTRSTFS